MNPSITKDSITKREFASFPFYEGQVEAKSRNLSQSTNFASGTFTVCCGDIMFEVQPDEYPEIERRLI